ncbi:hypothetical protein KFE25_001167 [Diacronema lutheri]|uniref:Calponin-homology (CH) domain-containing protein n=1 Tax=Diacronema lutheri TaxID=2081491 RepID=A0A8J5XD63_DIALT|nr:hypothetical protein KFE25_001167 [Diacronema lutheri]
MELLRSWLNDELRLSRPVRSFETDFRNGLLLGEILHRHGLLDDLSAMSKGDGPHAMIKNFNTLQPALRKLNITLDSRVANQIMVEKPGVATNVVYQLKLALDNATKAISTNLPTRRDRVDLSQTTLSTSRQLRAPHEEMRQRTFDQQLRMQATDPRELNMSHHLSKYTEAMYDMTRRALDEQQRESAAERELRASRMNHQRERLRESRSFMAEWTAESAARHRQTMRAKRAGEAEQLKWELTARERRARLERAATQQHANELSAGLDQFERTLRQLGAGGGAGGDDDEPAGDDDAAEIEAAAARMAANPTAHEHFMHLQTRLPDAESMAADVDEYLDQLRTRKAEEAVSRKEREVRRRRILIEQAQAQEALDAKRREEALLEKLGRQSAEEQRIAERLWRVRQEADVMRDNRQLRQDEIEARRTQDMAERVARNKARAAARLIEYKAALARERRRFDDAEVARAAVRRERRVVECRRVADELVAMAFRAHAYTGDAGRLLPARVWREMCTLFAAGVPLDALSGAGTTRAAEPDGALAGSTDVPLVPRAPADGTGDDEHRPSELLNEVDISHYLAGTGDWAADALADVAASLPPPDPSMPPPPPPSTAAEKAAAAAAAAGPAHVLMLGVAELAPRPEEVGSAIAGQAIYTILDAASPPPPPPPPPLLPEAKLRIALVGRPFAGKSTTALAIADELNLELLLPVELVHGAIVEHRAAEAARANAGSGALAADTATADDLADARAREGTQSLGKAGADALDAGKPVPDDVVAALVVRAVGAIDEGRRGFLIDGFPTTPAQLAALEKGLTGYEPVVDIKKKPPQSRLVPPPASASAPPPARKPGLDALVRLDITDELARRRALGRRVDPLSGAVFHLEFQPPADDDDLQQRLVPLGTDANVEAQLVPLLQANKDVEGALEAWGTTLGILRKVDAARTPDETAAAVRSLVVEIQAAKDRDAARASARAAEAADADVDVDVDAGAPPAGLAGEEPASAAGEHGGQLVAADGASGAPVIPLPPVPLDRPVAEALLEQWRTMEAAYLRTVKARFHLLREAEWAVLQHATSQARAYAERLAQPDNRQALVSAAQESFNALELELRADDDGKAELHVQADDLQDALWAAVDAKREACELELHTMALSGFAQHSALHLLNATLALVQAEADRAVASLACINQYFAARTGTWKPPPLSLPAVEIEPVSTVGVKLSLPKYAGLDPVAAHTAGRDAKGKGGGAAKKPPAGAKGAAAPPPRELPTPMTGELPHELLLQRTRVALALADAIDAAATAEDEAAAAAEVADRANADLPPAKAEHAAAVRAQHAELRAFWRAEAAKLRRRVRSLCVYGAGALAGAKADLEHLYSKLDGWLGARVRAELEAVGSLIRLMRAAIEAEVPLSHALELADGAALVVDETLLHVAPRPPPPVPPPRERLHELRLTVAQVAALGERFKAETRAPTLPLRAAIDVLLRAASAGELPPLWRRFERTVLHEACRLFTSGHAQQVSWHALLCALARMPAPTPAQLAEAAEALDRLALPGEKGGVALAGWEGVSLWFGARAARAAMDSAESHDGVAAADGDGAIAAVVPHGAAEFDVEAALKAALFHAFATRLPGVEPVLNHRRFLLCACDSIPKAFAVTAYAHSGAVTAEELHALLHRDLIPLPSQPVAELGAHADPFSMAVIHRLFAELNCDVSKDRVPYLMVANHPLGARVLSACELYRLNDVYGVLETKLADAGDALDI